MKPRVHISGRQGSTTNIKVGGTDVQISVGNNTPSTAGTLGHVRLDGDTRMPENVAKARTQRDMDKAIQANEDAFADPRKNVHSFGLKEGQRVADFGSGSGAYVLAMAGIIGDTGEVYGVDVQRELLTRLQNEATKKGYEQVRTIWGSIEEIDGTKIANELLDTVVISNTLFQVEEKHITLKEAWRVLKPQGKLIIIDWSDSFNGMGPPDRMLVPSAETIMLATDNGFILKKHFGAGAHHYGLIFVKHDSSAPSVAADGESIESVTPEDIAQAQKAEAQAFINRTIDQELI